MPFLSRCHKDVRRKKQFMSSFIEHPFCLRVPDIKQHRPQKCTLIALWGDKHFLWVWGVNDQKYQVCSFISSFSTCPQRRHFQRYQSWIVFPLSVFLGSFTSTGIKIRTVKLIEQLDLLQADVLQCDYLTFSPGEACLRSFQTTVTSLSTLAIL